MVTNAAASPLPKLIKHAGQKANATVSPPPVDSDPCVTYTQVPFQPAGCFGNGTDTGGEFWVWFTIYNAPNDTYTFTFEQSTDGGATTSPITTSSSGFQLQNSSSISLALGGSPNKCPSSNGGSPLKSSSFQVKAGPEDVQMGFHIGFSGTPADGTYTFICTLINSSNTIEAQAIASVLYPCP
jgi:hypothetical protein